MRHIEKIETVCDNQIVLTQYAHILLMNNLIRYGNQPDEVQQDALRQVLETYTLMAHGRKTGRFAFPLPTGYGKTQSIVAWIGALHRLGVPHISVAICASKVEALCDLKRDMMEQGVPEDVIGLLHSYKYKEAYTQGYLATGKWPYDGYATLPDTGESNEKPFLLVTHERVRAGRRKGTLEEFTVYKGGRRQQFPEKGEKSIHPLAKG